MATRFISNINPATNRSVDIECDCDELSEDDSAYEECECERQKELEDELEDLTDNDAVSDPPLTDEARDELYRRELRRQRLGATYNEDDDDDSDDDEITDNLDQASKFDMLPLLPATLRDVKYRPSDIRPLPSAMRSSDSDDSVPTDSEQCDPRASNLPLPPKMHQKQDNVPLVPPIINFAHRQSTQKRSGLRISKSKTNGDDVPLLAPQTLFGRRS